MCQILTRHTFLSESIHYTSWDLGEEEVVIISKFGEGECDNVIDLLFLRICNFIILFKSQQIRMSF